MKVYNYACMLQLFKGGKRRKTVEEDENAGKRRENEKNEEI